MIIFVGVISSTRTVKIVIEFDSLQLFEHVYFHQVCQLVRTFGNRCEVELLNGYNLIRNDYVIKLNCSRFSTCEQKISNMIMKNILNVLFQSILRMAIYSTKVLI